MGNHSVISNWAIVKSIDNEQITVVMEPNPACIGCATSGVCEVSSADNKQLSVPIREGIREGMRVRVSISGQSGFSALAIGYLIPFLLMFATLVILVSLGISEGLSGLIALGILIPYYGILYFVRNIINRKFHFEITSE